MDNTESSLHRSRRGATPESRERAQVQRARIMAQLRSRGFRWLYVLDVLVLLPGMFLINLARFGTDWPTYPFSHYAAGFAIATGIHLVVYYFGGLYEPEHRLGIRPWLPRVAALTFVAILFDALAALLTGRFLMPRFNLAVLGVVASLGLTLNRRLARWVRLQRGGGPRVLLVGNPDDINVARTHLHESDKPARVVGATHDTDDLEADVEEAGATDVLLLSGRALDDIYPEPLTTLERRGIELYQHASPRDTLLGLRELREVAGMPFIALHTHTLPRSRAHFKRVLELIGLTAAIPLVIPLVVFTALYVRVVAGAGVLYRQDRSGRNGVPFRMVKFRTMYPDAERETGAVLAEKEDPRVIPACRWLRSTRLDELPQLWNVLKGEMSIIGPRPERPELTEQFEELIPGYNRRHDIPPGITGLAQVQGRYHTDPGYKLGHDLQYLVNWSPIRDLQILIRTIWVVVSRRV